MTYATLPLLQQAKEVSVVEIVDDDADLAGARTRVDDVIEWLGRHGIGASGTVSETDESAADCVESAAGDIGADLIVAGAYGHSPCELRPRCPSRPASRSPDLSGRSLQRRSPER